MGTDNWLLVGAFIVVIGGPWLVLWVIDILFSIRIEFDVGLWLATVMLLIAINMRRD